MKSITAGLAVALAAFAVGAPPKSQITKVTSTNVGGGIEIAVIGENVSKPKAFFLSDQTTYIVQFSASLVPSSSGNVRVGEAGLNYYKFVRFQPGVSRVLLKVNKGVVPTVTQRDKNWYIQVGVSASTGTKANDSAEMQKAIAQMNNQLATFDSNVRNTGNVPIKIDGLNPGTIVGVENTVAFTEASYKSTLTATTAVPGPIGSPYRDTKITVAFNQADILTVFEGFARQAGVNIVTAPDVSPSDKPLLISLKLDEVDLDFAMTTVAFVADLRFTRIADTFVVTRAADFSSRVGSIIRMLGAPYETRVVNIASGEVSQIREATMQALPQDGPDGFYEIVDPTNRSSSGAFASVVAPANAGNSGAAGAAGAGQAGAVGQSTDGRTRYVMLIGEPRRLDVIESYVLNLDKRISASFSLAGSANYGSVVVPVMSGQTEKIKEMLGNLLQHNPRRNDYQIQETTVSDTGNGQQAVKMLMIAGPKDELDVLRKWADQMDTQLCEISGIVRSTGDDAFIQDYEVVELKFIEPTQTATDLKNRVRGLFASILPDPVTPNASVSTSSGSGAAGSTGAAGATGTGGSSAVPGAPLGHEQMRLVLRGTKAQILEAKSYLRQVDVPARQVALELRVMELTKQEALKIGLDWSLLTGGRLTNFRMNQGNGGDIGQGGHFSGTYQDNATTQLDVLGQLDSISNRNNLIARPNTLVSDGRSSHLFVGDTIRYIKAIVASANGLTVETGEVEVGVTIDVNARIGAEGNIALDLKQNFSLLQGFTNVPGGGQMPQTSDRTSEMFINMKDGETLALGGLILEQDRKRASGIPILKDLPIIGFLFKRTDNSKDRTEVVFFVTAKVVDNSSRALAATPNTGGGQVPPTADKTKGN